MMRGRRHGVGRWVIAGFLLFVTMGFPRAATAHELAEAAATLVIRDGGHVELRLLVPWAELLHRRLMPTRSMTDFLSRISAEPTPDTDRAIVSLQAELQREIGLSADRGRVLPFGRWRWPSVAEVRAALRQELMARLAGGDGEHPSRLQTTAEGMVAPGVTTRATFGRTLGPVLLTVVQPAEEWVSSGRTSTPLPILGRHPNGRPRKG